MTRLSRRRLLGQAASALALAATPLRAAPLRAAPPALDIVATTGMIADAARNIGGDLVNVRALMGSGVDPHSYRQTRSDIVALTRADHVLWHGLYLEAQMEDMLLKLSRRGTATPVGEAVPRAQRIAHDEYEGRFDPHVWMAPALWVHVLRAVRDALTTLAPAHADTFAANTDAYLARITQLDIYAQEVLSTVPPASRVLMTAHDAFGYFGRAYGFEVIGVQGISTESEAGLNRIRTLSTLLAERDIRAVFVETSVSDRNMRALAEGAAAQNHEVRIGGSLYSDAMGKPGSYEGTYIGMIDHNVTTIAAALGGQAPERGMHGLLQAGL